MNKKAELLAPAGSMESLKAAVNAGADAVYIGGNRFGARAYADNPDQEQLKEAIDFCHVHGRLLYMTVNTLLKEQELEKELYRYLLPLYEQGLDAVIVQDLGVLAFIRKQFPDLAIHASTQMSVTGADGAQLLKDLGVTRVVTARELSLKEIKMIYEKTGMELESFVHGALCYCYSGQCLFSSIIGGRSGNRGRCAQPCRLPYELYQENRRISSEEGAYLLSPKDMCTLELLPKILKSGVYSLKIEGRMKKPEYTAGVVRIYRKYLDLCLREQGRFFEVTQDDKRELMDLYNRGGFNQGYYEMQNAREMIALKRPNHCGVAAAKVTALKKGEIELQAVEELFKGDVLEALEAKEPRKTEFTLGRNRKKEERFTVKLPITGKIKKGWIFHRTKNKTLLEEISREYVYGNYQEKINGRLKILKNQPVILELGMGEKTVRIESDPPMEAQNQPLTEEKVRKQMEKTGNSSFRFENLKIDIEDGVFLPVQKLNELRREGLEKLKQMIVLSYRREKRQPYLEQKEEIKRQETTALFVELDNQDGLMELLKIREVRGFYMNDSAWEPLDNETEKKKTVDICHRAGKMCFYAMPMIFRMETRKRYEESWNRIIECGFDGMLVRNLEEIQFLKERNYEGEIVADHNLYTYNKQARSFLKSCGVKRDTAPLELNKKELAQRKCEGSEIVLYGRIPLMVSAQCLKKTTKGCNKKMEWLLLKDRKKKGFPIKTVCRFCYNIIYNEVPLSLMEEWGEIKQLYPDTVRLCFTTESKEEITEITTKFAQCIFYGQSPEKRNQEFTRGHFKRGVE